MNKVYQIILILLLMISVAMSASKRLMSLDGEMIDFIAVIDDRKEEPIQVSGDGDFIGEAITRVFLAEMPKFKKPQYPFAVDMVESAQNFYLGKNGNNSVLNLKLMSTLSNMTSYVKDVRKEKIKGVPLLGGATEDIVALKYFKDNPSKNHVAVFTYNYRFILKLGNLIIGNKLTIDSKGAFVVYERHKDKFKKLHTKKFKDKGKSLKVEVSGKPNFTPDFLVKEQEKTKKVFFKNMEADYKKAAMK